MPLSISDISNSGLPKKPTLAVVRYEVAPQNEKYCYYDGMTWGPISDTPSGALVDCEIGEKFTIVPSWWYPQHGEIYSWREVTLIEENPFAEIKLPEKAPFFDTPTKVPVAGYSTFVARRVKDPIGIIQTLNASKINLWHSATGISGEAGELLDCIKKHVVYKQPLNRENAIEELGDLEFYMEAARQELNISREEVLAANIAKLEKRYPVSYTDEAAKERADKA